MHTSKVEKLMKDPKQTREIYFWDVYGLKRREGLMSTFTHDWVLMCLSLTEVSLVHFSSFLETQISCHESPESPSPPSPKQLTFGVVEVRTQNRMQREKKRGHEKHDNTAYLYCATVRGSQD